MNIHVYQPILLFVGKNGYEDIHITNISNGCNKYPKAKQNNMTTVPKDITWVVVDDPEECYFDDYNGGFPYDYIPNIPIENDTRFYDLIQERQAPWDRQPIHTFLNNHTNYNLWKEILQQHTKDINLAMYCAIMEYIINAGGIHGIVDGNAFEFYKIVDVSLLSAITWWKILRIMHFSAKDLGFLHLTQQEVMLYRLDDYYNAYEENMRKDANVSVFYSDCVSIFDKVYTNLVNIAIV